jgi:hypothetical protein
VQHSELVCEWVGRQQNKHTRHSRERHPQSCGSVIFHRIDLKCVM